MAQTLKQVTGECEYCGMINVVLTVRRNSLMCDKCRADEDSVVPAIKVIEQSREVDAQIQIPQDFAQANTVATVELISAVLHDDSIPADQKDFVIAKESLTRLQTMQRAIFADREALREKEKAASELQKDVQVFIGKLRPELRAQFTTLDVNYTPVTPKVANPSRSGKKTSKTPKQGIKQISTTEVKEMAAKYHVDPVLVKMVAMSRHLSPEGAAKYLVEQGQSSK